MAGTSSGLKDLRWMFPEDAERRGDLVPEKYPERWFGGGEIGDESIEEASVRVSREPWEEDRERPVEALWSESSAEPWEWLDESDEAWRRVAVGISGAL